MLNILLLCNSGGRSLMYNKDNDPRLCELYKKTLVKLFVYPHSLRQFARSLIKWPDLKGDEMSNWLLNSWNVCFYSVAENDWISPTRHLKKISLFIINISEDVPFLKSHIGKPSLKKKCNIFYTRVNKAFKVQY